MAVVQALFCQFHIWKPEAVRGRWEIDRRALSKRPRPNHEGDEDQNTSLMQHLQGEQAMAMQVEAQVREGDLRAEGLANLLHHHHAKNEALPGRKHS
mmetsp:Transcript_32652/g.66249  ORF Transcript_32652/g.66249 Transcript_32652/m.66249 type:complete len:97 (-) Transcript_32652:363-653(-)